MNKLTFIGGDERQTYAIRYLEQKGYSIRYYGNNNISCEKIKSFKTFDKELFDCDVLVLPIPYKNKAGYINVPDSKTNIDIDILLKYIKDNTLIILGKIDDLLINKLNNRDFKFFDITMEENFSILNSIPSAEGAIQRAMEKTNFVIHNSKVLVLGYGRLGRALSKMLDAIGATVTVEARNYADLAWIEMEGYRSIHLNDLDTVLDYQDIIFNTIPAMILSKDRLKKLKQDCVIIDLASYPGGTDFKVAKELGLSAHLELGLPGTVAPKTSGLIIAKVINDILQNY